MEISLLTIINHILTFHIFWVNYNDLTATEPWNHGECMGNHPQMAARFRLVNYYNLPSKYIGKCHHPN